MTDKQKQAIILLNDLHERDNIDYEDYWLLLDFIVGNSISTEELFKPLQPFKYVPNEPNYEPYGKFGPVTCTTQTENDK